MSQDLKTAALLFMHGFELGDKIIARHQAAQDAKAKWQAQLYWRMQDLAERRKRNEAYERSITQHGELQKAQADWYRRRGAGGGSGKVSMGGQPISPEAQQFLQGASQLGVNVPAPADRPSISVDMPETPPPPIGAAPAPPPEDGSSSSSSSDFNEQYGGIVPSAPQLQGMVGGTAGPGSGFGMHAAPPPRYQTGGPVTTKRKSGLATGLNPWRNPYLALTGPGVPALPTTPAQRAAGRSGGAPVVEPPGEMINPEPDVSPPEGAPSAGGRSGASGVVDPSLTGVPVGTAGRGGRRAINTGFATDKWKALSDQTRAAAYDPVSDLQDVDNRMAVDRWGKTNLWAIPGSMTQPVAQSYPQVPGSPVTIDRTRSTQTYQGGGMIEQAEADVASPAQVGSTAQRASETTKEETKEDVRDRTSSGGSANAATGAPGVGTDSSSASNIGLSIGGEAGSVGAAVGGDAASVGVGTAAGTGEGTGESYWHGGFVPMYRHGGRVLRYQEGGDVEMATAYDAEGRPVTVQLRGREAARPTPTVRGNLPPAQPRDSEGGTLVDRPVEPWEMVDPRSNAAVPPPVSEWQPPPEAPPGTPPMRGEVRPGQPAPVVPTGGTPPRGPQTAVQTVPPMGGQGPTPGGQAAPAPAVATGDAFDPTRQQLDPRSGKRIDPTGRVVSNNAANEMTPISQAASDYAAHQYHLMTPDDHSARGYKAIMAGSGAANPGIVHQIFQKIDPQGTMPMNVKIEKAQQAVYDYWVSQKQPEKAAKVAFEIAQFGNQRAKEHGAEAMELLQKGNMTGAIQHLLAGYNWLPDGHTANYDARTNTVVMHDLGGSETARIPVQQGTLQNLAAGMATGELGWDIMRGRGQAPVQATSNQPGQPTAAAPASVSMAPPRAGPPAALPPGGIPPAVTAASQGQPAAVPAGPPAPTQQAAAAPPAGLQFEAPPARVPEQGGGEDSGSPAGQQGTTQQGAIDTGDQGRFRPRQVEVTTSPGGQPAKPAPTREDLLKRPEGYRLRPRPGEDAEQWYANNPNEVPRYDNGKPVEVPRYTGDPPERPRFEEMRQHHKYEHENRRKGLEQLATPVPRGDWPRVVTPAMKQNDDQLKQNLGDVDKAEAAFDHKVQTQQSAEQRAHRNRTSDERKEFKEDSYLTDQLKGHPDPDARDADIVTLVDKSKAIHAKLDKGIELTPDEERFITVQNSPLRYMRTEAQQVRLREVAQKIHENNPEMTAREALEAAVTFTSRVPSNGVGHNMLKGDKGTRYRKLGVNTATRNFVVENQAGEAIQIPEKTLTQIENLRRANIREFEKSEPERLKKYKDYKDTTLTSRGLKEAGKLFKGTLDPEMEAARGMQRLIE
jgi:hypothetical protein